MSLFCRHNRFTADCPICSKGTVLESGRRPARRAAAGEAKPRRSDPPPASSFSGPHVSAGPYEDEEGATYLVRLERVPGGLRLAEWDGSRLRRRAPVLAAADVPALVAGAREALGERDASALAEALREQPRPQGGAGVSRGRSGEFREELRVESVGDGRLRVARWVLRPGAGWELRDAPPMLPAARFAEALAGAVREGLVAVSAPDAPARP